MKSRFLVRLLAIAAASIILCLLVLLEQQRVAKINEEWKSLHTPLGVDLGYRGGIVVSICYHSLTPDTDDGLIGTIWDSGLMVWSQNPSHGGPPYCFGYIDDRRLKTILSYCETNVACDEQALFRGYVYFDCDFIRIRIVTSKCEVKLASGHEGLLSDPADGLDGDSEKYRHFVEVWDGIRSLFVESIPGKYEVYRGSIAECDN